MGRLVYVREVRRYHKSEKNVEDGEQELTGSIAGS